MPSNRKVDQRRCPHDRGALSQRLVEDPALAARVRTLQDRGKALEAADSRLLKALATDSGVADARAARAAAADAVAADAAAAEPAPP